MDGQVIPDNLLAWDVDQGEPDGLQNNQQRAAAGGAGLYDLGASREMPSICDML